MTAFSFVCVCVNFYFFTFSFFKFIYFNWRLITLQYFIGSATRQHESATGIHMFPILNRPSHLPPCTIPPGSPSAPAPRILYWTWMGDSFLIWCYTCFHAISPNHPTLSLSHRVQKTVLYICVSFAVSHHSLSEKCKSKQQWGTISRQSEWLQSKSLQAINTGEGVEKLHCWWECKLSLLFKTLSGFDIAILPRS